MVSRAHELEAELAELRWRVSAIKEHEPDPRQTVSERIQVFLRKHAGKTFSPRELMEAIDAGEESVRKALVQLTRPRRVCGASDAPAVAATLTTDTMIVRTDYATYQFDPYFGPSDHASAKAFEQWDDDR